MVMTQDMTPWPEVRLDEGPFLCFFFFFFFFLGKRHAFFIVLIESI